MRTGIYIVPTHRWYIERTVWLIAGLVLLLGTALAAFVHPAFSALIVILAGFSINVSLTGFCVVGNLLQKLGFTPMLGRSWASRCWCSRARGSASWRTACTG